MTPLQMSLKTNEKILKYNLGILSRNIDDGEHKGDYLGNIQVNQGCKSHYQFTDIHITN